MERKINIVKTTSKSYLYFIVIYLLIIEIKSFQYFNVFYLLSGEFLLITDEGIIKFNPSTNTPSTIKSSNIISSQDDQNYISFSQFTEEEGGYIICRLKKTIFVFNCNLDNEYGNFEVNEIENFYCDMKSYKTLSGKITIIISYINNECKMRLLMYQINLNQDNNFAELISQDTRQVESLYGEPQNVLNKGISCELIVKETYNHKLLSCFVADQYTKAIIASIFDLEGGLTFLYFSDNSIETSGTSIIKSTISPNGKNILICLVDISGYLECLVYNSDTNELSDKIQFFNGCHLNSPNTGVKYISEKNEYSAYCYTNEGNQMKFIKFDENLNIKDKDEDFDKCYNFFGIANAPCYTIVSSYLLYVKNDNKYSMFRVCNINGNYELNLLTISENCNTKIEGITGFNIENEINEIIVTTLPLETTILLESTIPTSLTTLLETEKESTIITSLPDLNLISTLIQTTIFSTSTFIPPTTISELSTTFITESSNILELPTTFITEYSTILEL